jgi:hypothetical protein
LQVAEVVETLMETVVAVEVVREDLEQQQVLLSTLALRLLLL